MNAPINHYTHADIESWGIPWGYVEDAHPDPQFPGKWLALDSDDAIKQDSLERLDRLFLAGLRSGDLRQSSRSVLTGRHDATQARDAAEVFYTNNLEVVLPTIMRQPKTSGIMTGPTAMLPIKSTLRPGQIAGVYDIMSTTGQAAHVEPNGARKLPTVGEFSERHKYTAGFIGAAYDVGLIEMWRSSEMGQPLESMRRMTAEGALQRFAERTLLYGDPGHEYLGVLANSHAYYEVLDKKFATATVEEAQVLLQIMEKIFMVIGESYSPEAQITGVIAPREDLRHLQKLRWDNDSPALPDFEAMHPWLKNVRWVEHIEASGPAGGSQWVFWSDDPMELWSELSPTPMLFGPWQDSQTGLRKSWAMIQQIGGVIMRRRERMVRIEQAA